MPRCCAKECGVCHWEHPLRFVAWGDDSWLLGADATESTAIMLDLGAATARQAGLWLRPQKCT